MFGIQDLGLWVQDLKLTLRTDSYRLSGVEAIKTLLSGRGFRVWDLGVSL